MARELQKMLPTQPKKKEPTAMSIALQKMLAARLEAEKRRRENCDLLVVDKDKNSFPYNLPERPQDGRKSRETLHSFYSRAGGAPANQQTQIAPSRQETDTLARVAESAAESERDAAPLALQPQKNTAMSSDLMLTNEQSTV